MRCERINSTRSISRETIADPVNSSVSCPVSHPASYCDRRIPPGSQNLHLYFNLTGKQVLTPSTLSATWEQQAQGGF